MCLFVRKTRKHAINSRTFSTSRQTRRMCLWHTLSKCRTPCVVLFSLRAIFFLDFYLKCASSPHLCVQAERVCCVVCMKGKWVVPMKSHSKLEATSAEFSFGTLRKHSLLEPFRSIYDIYLFSLLLFSSHPLHPHLHFYFGEHPICTCRRPRQKSSTGIISWIPFVAHRDSLYQTQTHPHIDIHTLASSHATCPLRHRP